MVANEPLAISLARTLAHADEEAALAAASGLPARVIEAVVRAAVEHGRGDDVSMSPASSGELSAPRTPPPAARRRSLGDDAETRNSGAQVRRIAPKELLIDARRWRSSASAPHSPHLLARSSAPRMDAPTRLCAVRNAARDYRPVTASSEPLRAVRPTAALGLRHLSLAGCERATDAALATILRVTNLTKLRLDRCVRLSDAALEFVAMQTSLRELSIASCKLVGDTGVAHLAALSELRVVSVERCGRVTDQGLGLALQCWPRLRTLKLGFCFKLSTKSIANIRLCPYLVYLDVRSTRVSSELWRVVASLPKLRALLAAHTQLNDEHVSKLALLDELRLLDVEGTQVGDALLMAVSEMRHLETLNLGYTQVKEGGVTKYVSKLSKSLLWLNLDDTDVGDYAAERLGVLCNLRSLNLADTSITSFGIAGVAALTELRALNLSFTGVTDSGLQLVSKLGKLETLSLDGEHVSDKGMRHVGSLVELRELEIYGANVSDDGMVHIRSLSKLKLLDMCLARIGDQGAQHVASLSTLVSLNLSQNRLGTQGVLSLLRGLGRLQTLNVAYNADVEEAVIDVMAVHSTLSCVCLQGTVAGIVPPRRLRERGMVVVCDTHAHFSA